MNLHKRIRPHADIRLLRFTTHWNQEFGGRYRYEIRQGWVWWEWIGQGEPDDIDEADDDYDPHRGWYDDINPDFCDEDGLEWAINDLRGWRLPDCNHDDCIALRDTP